MSTPSIKLTYFDIEGRAEPVRLALLLSGTDFEDERIAFGEWAALKPSTPYGQLPLLQINDGPPKTQSNAMLRWVGQEFSKTLYPPSLLYPIEEAIGLVGDLQEAWGPNLYIAMRPQRFGYEEDFAKTNEGQAKIKEMRQAFVEKELPQFMQWIQDMIDKNGGVWIASREFPTIADCIAVPTLRNFSRGFIDHVPADTLNKYPQIVEYIERFCALEPIQGRYSDGIH